MIKKREITLEELESLPNPFEVPIHVFKKKLKEMGIELGSRTTMHFNPIKKVLVFETRKNDDPK